MNPFAPVIRHVLYVEDADPDIFIFKRIVKDLPKAPTLEVVKDGDAAWAYMMRLTPFEHARRPDVIFLDLNIPKRSGMELLTACKSDPALAIIPIVVLTSSRDAQDIQQAYRSGANAYLTKQNRFHVFRDMIFVACKFWLDLCELAVPEDGAHG